MTTKSPISESPQYASADEARIATDAFYQSTGFEYTPQQVRDWLAIYLPRMPQKGNVLDLCCGDGVWSQGIKAISPGLVMHGIDLSSGGIEKARTLLPDDAARFVVGDAEQHLPWPDETFDLVFVRGPGLYNQHSMDRPATIAVIERWHRVLKPSGKCVSMFYSDPEKFGTYSNPLSVTLPYNRAPRLTEAVDFTGGKYHHDISSFLAPFRKVRGVRMGEYRFIRNNHILETMREKAVTPG